MITLFTAKCRPTHVLTLAASLIQASYFLFTPSPRSSGNDLIVTTTRTIPTISKVPTPTIRLPTPTTPHLIVNDPGSLGLCLACFALFTGFLFGLAMVYSRTGCKHADSIHPSSRQATPPPPTNGSENNDEKGDTHNGDTDNDDTDPDDTDPDDTDPNDTDPNDTDPDDSGDKGTGAGAGAGDEDGDDDDDEDGDGDGDGEGDGDSDGDSDGSDDTTDEQEDDNTPNETDPHDEPDPEDPPPPSPAAFDDNNNDPRTILHGPALSLLHFLLGVAAGFLTRMVTMNPTRYRRELNLLSRKITSRLLAMKIGFFRPRLSKSLIVEMPYSSHSRPFIVATAQSRNSSQRRRTKVSLPTSLIMIMKYTVDIIARFSPIYVFFADTIRPLVNWLVPAEMSLPASLTILIKDTVDVIARFSPMCVFLADTIRPMVDRLVPAEVGLPASLTIIIKDIIAEFSPICVSLTDTIKPLVNYLVLAKICLPALFAIITEYTVAIIAEFYPMCVFLADTIQSPVDWFIHAMAQDLVVVEAYLSLAINRMRAIDTDHGALLRLIAGCTVLLLVALEVYNAKLPASPVHRTNTDLYYGDDVLFPFADVDFPLEDSESQQLSTVRLDSVDEFVDNGTIFPFHDVDFPLAEVEFNDLAIDQTIVADPASLEDNDGAASSNKIEPVIETDVEHCQNMEEISADCILTLPFESMDIEQAEAPEANTDIHEANNTLADELPPSAYDEDFSINVDVHTLAAEDVKAVEIPTWVSSVEDAHTVSFEEDPDAVLECLAGLFDSWWPVCPLHAEAVEEEEITKLSNAEDSQMELIVVEDPDTILECLADFFDLPMVPSFAEKEGASSSTVQDEVTLVPVSPSRTPDDVCVRAFTSCETFATMFGFDQEEPSEFLRPLPARLERLLPPFWISPSTPARNFTLGAPPATPTTPYARWIEENHQNTPFIPSPFRLPRTPPRTPPTIVIPSPTSSEGTQPADESPAAIRARRLDRKWAKLMEKRRRNDASFVVPRVQIEETSFSSSLASDTSIQSFFDPHASINRSIRDTKVEAEPTKPTTKWKPRGPGDPVPQRRRWRKKDVLVGAGEDESYGAIAALD